MPGPIRFHNAVVPLTLLAHAAAAQTLGTLPELRPPPDGRPGPPVISALATQRVMLPPLPFANTDMPQDLAGVAVLREAVQNEVSGLVQTNRIWRAAVIARASAMLGMTGHTLDAPQLLLVVDRNPSVERIALMLASPGGPDAWISIGAAKVSTGQSGRKDYYVTPIGVFAHTDAILDFRAQGTYNEHHVRGLGTAGMRVWDFGWQWALKGWHTDGAGGDIRLQMHATDPALLERRLGHPASEGCVRLSSSMNRFLDRHGILDADYEHAAIDQVRYRALLQADRQPSPLAGRLLVIIDTSLPTDAPPTAAGRPAGWPDPNATPPPSPDPAGVDSALHQAPTLP